MSQPTSSPSLADALAGWPPPAMDPAGPFAGAINPLTWALIAMFVLVLLVVLAALALALFGPERWRQRIGGQRILWIGGLGFPTLVVFGFFAWSSMATGRVAGDPPSGEMRIRVTGEMWWWRVAYLDSEGRELFHEANEVHVPAGTPVTFELQAADVIHSFWVPRLGGKMDMVPGRRNLLRLQADKPGVYAGQCTEYCGGPHALMGFVLVAHAPAEFERWKAARLAPAAAPAERLAARGAVVFDEAGCGACHTVRGTQANGMAGPDLTHIGSRLSIGAGILPHNAGVLAGWIADSQTIKPGNRMPPYRVLSGEDLRAVAAYLDGLK